MLTLITGRRSPEFKSAFDGRVNESHAMQGCPTTDWVRMFGFFAEHGNSQSEQQ
jgi:hypothetical protein